MFFLEPILRGFFFVYRFERKFSFDSYAVMHCVSKMFLSKVLRLIKKFTLTENCSPFMFLFLFSFSLGCYPILLISFFLFSRLDTNGF